MRASQIFCTCPTVFSFHWTKWFELSQKLLDVGAGAGIKGLELEFRLRWQPEVDVRPLTRPVCWQQVRLDLISVATFHTTHITILVQYSITLWRWIFYKNKTNRFAAGCLCKSLSMVVFQTTPTILQKEKLLLTHSHTSYVPYAGTNHLKSFLSRDSRATAN